MARKRVSPAPVATDDVSLLEKYKDFKGIAVLERRLESPDLPGTLAIRLKDEPTHLVDPQGKKRTWYLRWINGGEAGRFSQVTDLLGYVPVRIDELQNPESVLGASESKDGIVRRGDRGQEVLVKMPLELYTAIKARQQDLRERRFHNAAAVKSDLANAAGQSLGDEAGETVQNDFRLSIQHHRSTLGAELDELPETTEA